MAVSKGPKKEYLSGASADTATFAATPASWVMILGAGSTVLADGEGNAVTLTTDAIEPNAVIPGPFTAFTSTTATRVRMGVGLVPRSPAAVSAASIAAGSLAPFIAIAVANQATLSGLAQTVDGVALSTAGMRVYLAKQTTAAQNGAWVVGAGAWTRPADWASGATIPLGTLVVVAPGGTANHIAFGSIWYVDSASGVVDTGTIVAYPKICKGSVALTSASPSTGAVTSLWIKHATQTSLSLTNETTAANGVKGTIVAGAGTGSLAITGPNTVTDVISWLAVNG